MKEEGDEMRDEVERRVESDGVRDAGRRIRDDDTLCAEPPRDTYRHVRNEAAVAERLPVDLLGREDQWNRVARTKCAREIALADDDEAAIGEIRRDRAKGGGERVEVAARQQIAAQREIVRDRIRLGRARGGALEIEAALALLPVEERLQEVERARLQ